MPVRFFYIDESYNDDTFCLSAISIRYDHWKTCFDKIKAHRQRLKEDHGLFIQKEIHARDFVTGRGRVSPEGKPISKWLRSRIFHSLLELVAGFPEVLLFNVVLPVAGCPDPQMKAWDRLINRIERTMLEFEKKETARRARLLAQVRGKISADDMEALEYRLNVFCSRAFIVSDEGREVEITRALRKMHVLNHIPSKYGGWATGDATKNIVTERILEDPLFKESHRSHFLQLADCVAFALLKREVVPTPVIEKYGIHKMFDEVLSPICYQKASPSDPLGIVRK